MANPELVEARAGTELDDARRTRGRYLVLGSACLLAIVTYILRVGFAPASAEFKVPLGLDSRHLGYLMAAFMIAYGVFEIPWGLASDKLGVRTVLVLIAL